MTVCSPHSRRGSSGPVVPSSRDDVIFASYGHFFRPEAEVLSPDPYFDEEDVEEGYESELLMALWQRAACSRRSGGATRRGSTCPHAGVGVPSPGGPEQVTVSRRRQRQPFNW